jgi:hypothetical protein
VLVVGAIEIIEVNPVSITVGLKVTDDTEDGGVSAGAGACGNHDPVDDRPLSGCEMEKRIVRRMREVCGEDVFASDGEREVLGKKGLGELSADAVEDGFRVVFEQQSAELASAVLELAQCSGHR